MIRVAARLFDRGEVQATAMHVLINNRPSPRSG
jgi:hypothetical protein